MDLSDFPRGYGPMRPVAIEGLVIAMTPITKYTRGARFLCAEEKCPCSRGFHHIRVHAPGATESATVRNDFICFLCTSPLKEDVKSRVLGDPCLVSDNFKALHATSASSPWRFSAIVANTFASPVVPPGLYSTLKLLLLLSLVQTEGENEEAHNHLDVLAITSDTLIIDRLMTYCLGLAARGVRHPVTGELFASLSRDDHGTGTANIRAGSALLATGGVCLLGDLTCYKRDRIDALQSVLENRAVSVFIPGKKYGEDADQLLSFPVQCNFWALTDAATPSRKLIRPETIVLGSVLLAHARGLKVDMSPEAEKMIYGYYMASRRVRSDSAQASLVSVTSIKLLIALAQAHAKLNLRTRVLEYDAVIAVLLCENSITLKHGASALVIPPDATFPCDLRDLDSLQRRDLTLEGFHQQILHFVYTYAPGPATYITEE
ncbi:hypothetical protein P4O66_000087 [Electrophorus voltai]|uniref:MCM AAA-lid domain-containing protein n=1 Tax=Electrophorus voltai TaxID=2609070 RepID=A0AAD8ZWD8_9TELE|nr:hypothetical protein P4O66_000087 [Electrophorus voltai]